ncbi:MAG: alpha/beta hydrolase-fold protein, partial [candidate division KSB1 bacterium]
MLKKNPLAACAITLVLAVVGTVLVCDHLFGLFDRRAVSANVVFSKMPSKILKEEREVIIHLPESYTREPARRFPVLYVLDGSSQDFHTARSAALMARIGVMPEI